MSVSSYSVDSADEEKLAYNYSSDDDEKWQLQEDDTPLLNILTFGWMEDGRLGYPPDKKSYTQFDPKPVPSLRSLIGQHYVVKAASAGDRHTLILMIRLHRDIAYTNPHTSIVSEQRSKKLMMVGLNQQGLCEEPGFNQAVEIECETVEDPPVHLVAGKGNSFYVTRRGKIFSFGVGRYGILGHGDDVTNQVPRLIKGMSREFVLKLSVGDSHALALIEGNGMYSWGRNHKGQLGRSFESPFEAQPHQVVLTALKNGKYRIEDVACGENHSIILVAVTGRENVVSTLIYGWGDESRGQLGSGDVSTRCRPMENRMFSRLIKKSGVKISKIAAGGNHNLALTKYGGQVISWGAGDYGQLGSGYSWDDPQPKFINQLKNVVDIAAGSRHSLALVYSQTTEVYGWGYNAYGELGLGDVDVRLHPTKITAIKNTRVGKISCGARHSVLVTSHKPSKASDDPILRPYFQVLNAEKGNKKILNRLKFSMHKAGLDSTILDTPNAIVPNQGGASDDPLKNDFYEKGFRYCLDTFSDPLDWRRKAYEVCYECIMPKKPLKTVCLSCARNCLSDRRLVAYIRTRNSTDTCDCRTSGICKCSWSPLRGEFDRIVGEDQCIGPNQVRPLLKTLRVPYPVDSADVENCLLQIAEGREDLDTPRITAIAFEKWYRRYFDEQGANLDDEKSVASATSKGSFTSK